VVLLPWGGVFARALCMGRGVSTHGSSLLKRRRGLSPAPSRWDLPLSYSGPLVKEIEQIFGPSLRQRLRLYEGVPAVELVADAGWAGAAPAGPGQEVALHWHFADPDRQLANIGEIAYDDNGVRRRGGNGRQCGRGGRGWRVGIGVEATPCAESQRHTALAVASSERWRWSDRPTASVN